MVRVRVMVMVKKSIYYSVLADEKQQRNKMLDHLYAGFV
jgi:hypothetical protein